MIWTRDPAVAGHFYPSDPIKLRQVVESLCVPGPARRPLMAWAPHAGYVYSGAVAGKLYGHLDVPDTVVILCPNHTGRGPRVSVWPKGEWRTPLGKVAVNEDLAAALMDRLGAAPDREAHLLEHAIEVQLPFLQVRSSSVRIVPVVLGGLVWDQVAKVGEALGALEPSGTLLLASTDMSHYVSAEEARRKDTLALDCVERLDGAGLYRTVVENEISMCGFVPTAAALLAAGRWGLIRGQGLAYGNSGEVTGDPRSVVGYASGWALPDS